MKTPKELLRDLGVDVPSGAELAAALKDKSEATCESCKKKLGTGDPKWRTSGAGGAAFCSYSCMREWEKQQVD